MLCVLSAFDFPDPILRSRVDLFRRNAEACIKLLEPQTNLLAQ